MIWMLLVGISVLAWSDVPVLQQDFARFSPQEPQNPVRRQNAQNNRGQNNQQNNRQGNQQSRSRKDTAKITAQPILMEEEEIPDSLLHPRWRIQRTQPITEEDLQRKTTDLSMPENIEQKVVHRPGAGRL